MVDSAPTIVSGLTEPGLVVDRAVRSRDRGRAGPGGTPVVPTSAVAARLGPLERAVHDLGQRDQDRRVEITALERRQHLVEVDVLELALAEGETGASVELDLAMLEARVEIEQDDQPVVDAGTPDAPLVHQGGGVALGLLGRDVVASEGLGVDHDLGLGLRLDRVDDRLGLALRASA